MWWLLADPCHVLHGSLLRCSQLVVMRECRSIPGRVPAIVCRTALLQQSSWSHVAALNAINGVRLLTLLLRCLRSAPLPRASEVPTTTADAPAPAAPAAPSVPVEPATAASMGPVTAAPPVRPCCHFVCFQLQAASVQSLAGPQAAVSSMRDHPSTATRQLDSTCRARRQAWRPCFRTRT